MHIILIMHLNTPFSEDFIARIFINAVKFNGIYCLIKLILNGDVCSIVVVIPDHIRTVRLIFMPNSTR